MYHGPDGLKAIAARVHALAARLERGLGALGFAQANAHYFDTLFVDAKDPATVDHPCGGRRGAHQPSLHGITMSASRSTRRRRMPAVEAIVGVFAQAAGKAAAGASAAKADGAGKQADGEARYPAGLARRSAYLTHPIFSTHRSETSMMRYIRALARKDIGLDVSMIPLGSCTMKLNAASEMLPITWPEFGRLHPFAPVEQAQGYQQVFAELEASLREITGFAGISLQPNSGAG